MFKSHSIVQVTVYTCMGKGHHFTVPYYTAHYGENDDRLLFVNAVCLAPYSANRQDSIVPNTDIPTLIKSERCCSIIVEHTNCDQTLRLTFTGSLKVNEDYSISYDRVERSTTVNSEEE